MMVGDLVMKLIDSVDLDACQLCIIIEAGEEYVRVYCAGHAAAHWYHMNNFRVMGEYDAA